jgi:ketosteroid isomerase-like protein
MPKQCLAAMLLLTTGLFATEAEIRAWTKSFHDRALAGDAAGLKSMMAEELVYSHSDTKVETREQASEVIAQRKQTFEFLPGPHIRIYGKTAVYRGDVNARYMNDGAEQFTPINILMVFEKRAGKWILVMRQATRRPQ